MYGLNASFWIHPPLYGDRGANTVVEKLQGHWSAWFDDMPQVAFSGATLASMETNAGRVNRAAREKCHSPPNAGQYSTDCGARCCRRLACRTGINLAALHRPRPIIRYRSPQSPQTQ